MQAQISEMNLSFDIFHMEFCMAFFINHVWYMCRESCSLLRLCENIR